MLGILILVAALIPFAADHPKPKPTVPVLWIRVREVPTGFGVAQIRDSFTVNEPLPNPLKGDDQ